MRVIDINDNELSSNHESFEYDKAIGKLLYESIVTKHHEAQEYQPEIRSEEPTVIAEYFSEYDEDGIGIGTPYGTDVEYEVLQEEVQEQPAFDEIEAVYRYIEFSEDELNRNLLTELKIELAASDDYLLQTLEYIVPAGLIEPHIKRRQAIRKQVSDLEKIIGGQNA